MVMGVRGKITILIVEDHRVVRSALRLSLEQYESFCVLGEAGDGESAVRQALELKPDIVLMDIGLPVMDGIQAAREIKEALPDTGLVMLTSHDSENEIFSALAAGADGYCLKTSSENQLQLAITSVANQAVWLDPAIAKRILKVSTSRPAAEIQAKEEDKFPLSDRELEVLGHVVDGLSNQQIATRLFLSPDTIKTHMKHIMGKLMVSDRTQAAVVAMRKGLFN